MRKGKKKPQKTMTDIFFDLVIEKFRFLIDEFRFKKGARKKEAGVYQIAYQNETTAVEISFEWRDQYIYVRLYRLINGTKQEDPIVIQHYSELNNFDLEDLLSLRKPSLKISPSIFGRALSKQDIETILEKYAIAIHKHAIDILQGDFSIFAELEKIVKSRI